MADSNTTDADIKLKATLDAGDVQSELQKIGTDASASLDAATRSADGLANSMGKVSDSAKMSSQQIGNLAVSMAGMGLQLAGSIMEARGGDSNISRYLKGAGAGAVTGATMGLRTMNPYAIAAMTVGGAAVGAGTEHFNILGDERKDAEAEAERVRATQRMLSQYDKVRAADEESREFYGSLADKANAMELLTDRMERFKAGADMLREALDDPEIQTSSTAVATLMQSLQGMNKEVDRAKMSMDALKGVATKEAAPSGGGVIGDFDALQKMGITVGGGSGVMNTLASLQGRANEFLASIADDMRELNMKPTGWGV